MRVPLCVDHLINVINNYVCNNSSFNSSQELFLKIVYDQFHCYRSSKFLLCQPNTHNERP